MRFSAIVVATGLAISASAGPVSPNSAPLQVRQVASDQSAGFKVPDELADGSYSVFWENGAFVHEFVGNDTLPQSANVAEPEKRDIERRGVLDFWCGGYELNHADTDRANDLLDAQCEGGGTIHPRYSYYSKVGNVVAFACNSVSYNRQCFPFSRVETSAAITRHCGWYIAGSGQQYSNFGMGAIKPGLTYGYDRKDANFCPYL